MKKTLLFPAVFCLTLLSCVQSPDRLPVYPDLLKRTTPESEGVDSRAVIDYLDAVEASSVELHSFMILRNARVVAEGWWNPYHPTLRHIMYSVSKTFTSTAIGFAVDEGLLATGDRVVSFFPDYGDAYGENPNIRELTVYDLLIMRAGSEPYVDFRLRSDDWIDDFFRNEIEDDYKTVFRYNSYATYMLSAILQRVTGEDMLQYLGPRLFEPLGISGVRSERSPAGIVCGGWGMSVLTADMAKLGQLYLQKGVWNGKQIISGRWIEEATSAHVDLSTGPDSDLTSGYGYQLWLGPAGGYRMDGAYGQYVIVLPEKNAVIAMTAHGNDLRMVADLLIPAVTDEKKLPADKESYKALRAKTAALQIDKAPGRTDDTGSIEMDEAYYFEENRADIRSIHFRTDGDSGVFSIRTGSCLNVFDLRRDDWAYTATERNSPYYNRPYRNPVGLTPFAVAGRYRAEADGTVRVTLLYPEDASRESFVINTDGDSVSVAYSNSEETGDAIDLTGRRFTF